MNYAKIEFLSSSGVIFSPASGSFAPRPHWGSDPGPDLPLLFKLHNICLVDWFLSVASAAACSVPHL